MGFVLNVALAGGGFPGGKFLGAGRGEDHQVVAEIIDVAVLRTHDHKRGLGMLNQIGRHQRAA